VSALLVAEPPAAWTTAETAAEVLLVAGIVAVAMTVPGVEAVGVAVEATPWQLFIWLRQSIPENAEPARLAQELN